MSSSVPVLDGQDDAAAEAAPTPFSPALVEEMLRSLTKTIRTHQLYLPNNPIYQRAIDGLRVAFAALWQETSELVIEVTASEFRWLGHVVMRETSRAESLPWVFYKDGLRELTFLQGVEDSELAVLLDIIHRIRIASPEEDDLLTLLWEQEFLSFRYRFVDVAFDDAAPLTPGEAHEPATKASVRDEVAAEEMHPNIVRMEDFDSATYFLDEQEVDYLRREIQTEYQTDLRRNIIAMLLDIFELETSPATREELCGVLEGVVLHLLSEGQYGAVAYLLREAKTVASRAAELTAEHRARLAQLPARLGQPDVLSELLRALDSAEAIPAQEDLDALFEQLGGGTLGVVLGWVGRVQNTLLSAILEKTATRLAAANTGALVQLIASTDEAVSLEAMRRSGALRTPAAVTPLGAILSGASVRLRQGAAQALAEIGSPGALRLLEDAVDDEDRDVRLTAVRALGAFNHRAALPKVGDVVSGKAVRDCDLTEKMVFFEAFSILAGDGGIEPLDRLLNAKGLFGRRADPETRACAAMALGRIGTRDAMATLERAASDKDVLVRNAINKALRGGGT
ncbi:MAG TPA: HEAT repeat domain-containing protein [Gemmatimonadaceae bacterium]|nr:HEAT repeat domain-containing protein [Gemmatimonadaceae bacterium]